MPAIRVLSNGHEVEDILYEEVCFILRDVAGENIMRTDEINRDWIGKQALRELWLKCTYSNYSVDKDSAQLLSKFRLCNSNGFVSENIGNIIMSLTKIENGNIIMELPSFSPLTPGKPILAQITLNLGSAPKF